MTAQQTDSKQSIAATGGLVGAVLASSCCIGPLVLVSLGVSGAWIGNLSLLKDYQPVFVAVALIFIGIGFWQVYGKPNPQCDDRTVCDKPKAQRVVKVAIWVSVFLIVIALTADYWAPIFY